MIAVFYFIVATSLATWSVLDGFDFGAGIVQPLVARDESERGLIHAAIGPVWDGNEVWLIASGGVFVFAFPHAYAVAMSGMYLPLMLVLWLLIFRGLAIELRGQLEHPMWRAASDTLFCAASTAMALVAGVAIGAVVRGFPLDATGAFHLDLFTLGGHPGAIDPYTGAVGLFAVAVLGTHGASFLAWKTEGEVRARAVLAARRGWAVVIPAAIAVTLATAWVRPALATALLARPWAWPWPAIAAACPALGLRSLSTGRDLRALLASGAFIAALLLATATTLYPVLLASTVSPRFDLDATTAASSAARSVAWGLSWWLPAAGLAGLYFVNLFRTNRGRVSTSSPGP